MQGGLPYVDLADLKGPLVFLFHGIAALLTPGSFLGACLLHAPLVGLGLLYAYKSARLFLNVSQSSAALGGYVAFLLYFAVNPAEQVWVMQHVTLFFVLRWASGIQSSFKCSELFLFGAFVAAALLLKFNLVAFWGPVCVLALCVCRWQGLLWQGLGFVVVMVPFLVYFYMHGALHAMWDEYVGMALKYGRVEWPESALCQRHWLLFQGMTWYHLHRILPEELLAVMGAVPALAWPLLWLNRRSHLKTSLLFVLAAAFVILGYASYSGKFDFIHYAYVFYPFCFLSLVLLISRLNPGKRVAVIFGALVAGGTLCVSLALPVYVKFGRSYNGNAEMKETALRLVQWLESVPDSDFFLLDADKSLHLYRLSGKMPAIRHFVPPVIPNGHQMFRAEQMAYIQKMRPKYLLGSEWCKKQEAQVITQSGVSYRMTSHREWGLPAYPAHARQPELILYTRVDE